MIDNSEAIKKLMHFEMEGDVYFVQVMQRGKDKGNNRVTAFPLKMSSVIPSSAVWNTRGCFFLCSLPISVRKALIP